MASLLEINGVNDFIVAIILITVKVLGLTAVSCEQSPDVSSQPQDKYWGGWSTRVVEEEGIVGLSIANQPAHGANNVFPCRLHNWIALIICQEHHILSLIAMILGQKGRNIVDIVDAPSKLTILSKVVDANQKCLAAAGTVGILEGVTVGSAMTKGLRAVRRRRAWPSMMGGIACTGERVAVGIKAGGRRVVWRWRSVEAATMPTLGPILTMLATIITSVSTITARLAIALLRRGRTGRRWVIAPVSALAAVTLLRRGRARGRTVTSSIARVAWILTVMVLRAVMALAWVGHIAID